MNKSESDKPSIDIRQMLPVWLIFFGAFLLLMAFSDVVFPAANRPGYPTQFFIPPVGASVCLGLWQFGRWLCNPRNLACFLTGLAIFGTLAAGFYLEEDWRGKRAWEHFRADAEARGIELDWSKLMPPAVPDDQNFFTASTNIAIRFKKAQTDAEVGAAEQHRNGWLIFNYETNAFPVFDNLKGSPLIVANLHILPPGKTTDTNSPAIMWNEPTARKQLRDAIEAAIGQSTEGAVTGVRFSERQLRDLQPVNIYVQADLPPSTETLSELVSLDTATNLGRLQFVAPFNGSVMRLQLTDAHVTAAADYLKWSDQYEPALDEVREALKRSAAILPGDYSKPYAMPIPNFIVMRAAAQNLAQRAQCFLLLHQPDEALRELVLMHDLCRILHRPPAGKPITLVESMINVAILGLHSSTVQDGLRWHAWQEPQLAVLEQELEGEDVSALVVDSLNCEQAFAATTMINTPTPTFPKAIWSRTEDPVWGGVSAPFYMYISFGPRGWIYQNVIHHVAWMQQFLGAYDVSNQVIQPQIVMASAKKLERMNRWAPYSYLAAIPMPNPLKVAQITAFDQTQINEAEIACALERYRFKTGQYPEALGALAPQFIGKLPHDIVGGEPLHYSRTGDGSFRLYSVGWNEKDDGGANGMVKPGAGDYAKGDWVWRNK